MGALGENFRNVEAARYSPGRIPLPGGDSNGDVAGIAPVRNQR